MKRINLFVFITLLIGSFIQANRAQARLRLEPKPTPTPAPAPVVWFLSPLEAQTVSGSLTVVFDIPSKPSSTNPNAVWWTRLEVDGVAVATGYNDLKWNTTTGSNGYHLLRVDAFAYGGTIPIGGAQVYVVVNNGVQATTAPTSAPTAQPTTAPTFKSLQPTSSPTTAPPPTSTAKPTQGPTPLPTQTPVPTPTVNPPGGFAISVSGNHLADGNGNTVFLHGVDIGGPAYGCLGGWMSDTPLTSATVAAMKTWKINAVRLALNESCWLGINGEPNGMTAAAYRNSIVGFTTLLEQNGIYPILDLHWLAPGSYQADAQEPAPDADHAAAFWQSLASTYANDKAAIFDLQNEPHVSWSTWLNGGSATCQTNQGAASNPCPSGTGYATAGVNSLISAIRSTEGNNWHHVVDAENDNGSLAFASWLSYRPTDPVGQLVGDFHWYNTPGSDCQTNTCLVTTYGAVQAQVPVISTEIGDISGSNSCVWTAALSSFLNWMNSNSSGYVAWSWLQQGNSGNCSGPTLLSTNPAGYQGTPNPYGQGYQQYLLSLP